MQVQQKYKVQINLYDLSGGMAKVFSPMFLGKEIQGIWHTGIIVYGIEYYFGGGICQGRPGDTPYGAPISTIDLGETELGKDLFNEFLREISSKFSYQTYDLLKNNCNNFTDECAKFLLSKGIPDYIVNLPSEVLSTQMGQMIKPIIDQMQNKVINDGTGHQMFPQMFEGNSYGQGQNFQQQPQQGQNNQPQNQNNGENQDYLKTSILNNIQAPKQELKKVKEIKGMEEYIEINEKENKFVICFFDDLIGPCALIKPLYSTFSEEFPEIKFFYVDAKDNKELIETFEVNCFPTFVSFFQQEILERWAGANQIKLKDKLNKLQAK